MRLKNIPNVIQKLGIWQGGRANFFLGASDHCAGTRRERKKKTCSVANAAKNQLLNHVRYTLFASLLSLSLTQCTWQPAASKEFEPAPAPVIHRTGYTLAYDGRTRHANWVYEELTAESLKGETERSNFDFTEDPLLPAHLRASKSDYRGSGYDRGHLCPAGNARFSSETMKDTFYLSNISPQHPQLNRKYWVKLEKYVRDMTKSYAKVCVITGPLFIPELNEDGKKYVRYQVIGENQVAVPTHYFKVIYGKTDLKVVTEAYLIPNRPIDNDPPLQNFSVTLEKVEKAAGLTFRKIP